MNLLLFVGFLSSSANRGKNLIYFWINKRRFTSFLYPMFQHRRPSSWRNLFQSENNKKCCPLCWIQAHCRANGQQQGVSFTVSSFMSESHVTGFDATRLLYGHYYLKRKQFRPIFLSSSFQVQVLIKGFSRKKEEERKYVNAVLMNPNDSTPENTHPHTFFLSHNWPSHQWCYVISIFFRDRIVIATSIHNTLFLTVAVDNAKMLRLPQWATKTERAPYFNMLV